MTVPYKPQQSPIDLGTATNVAAVFPTHYLDLRWDGPLEGEPEGDPGEVNFVFKNIDPGVGIALDGKFFRLVKYHFHTPSEHKVNGTAWPLELHVVHQNPKDNLLAVLGVWVEGGKARPEASRFFKELTERLSSENKKGTPSATVRHDPRDMLPVDRGDFYRYEGSLTTNREADNPVTVSWLIFRETLRVDDATLKEFLKYAHAAKGLQDPARRFVLRNFIPAK
jgi:carbonic anhydrase